MERDTKRIRGEKPYVFTNLKDGTGVDAVIDWIRHALLFNRANVKRIPSASGATASFGCDSSAAARRTILAQCRFKLPLQALTPLTLADGTAYLMLLNPTGGLVGGDLLTTQIVQEAGTHVCLTTPSATRVYRTAEKPAVQETVIQLGEGASLEYLPDHVIPHRDSALHQSLRVEMGRGSRAIFWDALAAGRVAHGERWNFTEWIRERKSTHAASRRMSIGRGSFPPNETARSAGMDGGLRLHVLHGLVRGRIHELERNLLPH